MEVNPPPPPPEAEQLADALELDLLATALTNEGEPGAAHRLRDLDKALRHGPDEELNAWAGSDLYKLIDTEGVVERIKVRGTTHWLIGVFEWLRNFLVLLPITLTWLGISQAIRAYGQLVQNDQRQVSLPFLYLWQQGFNGYLQDGFTLGTLAFVDFWLLVGVLSLTFFIAWYSHFRANLRELAAEEVRVKLADTLARASLGLHKLDKSQPGHFVQHFDQVAQQLFAQLDQERLLFDQIIQQVQQGMSAWGTALPELAQISTEMSATATTFQQTSVTFKETTDLLDQTNRALQATGNGLTTSIDQLSQAAQDIASKHTMVSFEAQNIANGIQGLLNTQNAVLQDQQQWGTHIANALNTMQQELQHTLSTLNQSLADMKLGVETISTTTYQLQQEFMRFAGDMGQLTTRQSEFVQKMENQVSAQNQIYGQVSELATTMTIVAKQVQIVQASMDGMWVEMTKIVNLLVSLPTKWQANLDPILIKDANTSDMLNIASGNLERAANTIGQASTTLLQVVNQLQKP